MKSSGEYPCKNCKERTIGCHDKCDKYLMEKNRRDALKCLMKKQKRLESDVAEVAAYRKRHDTRSKNDVFKTRRK